MIRIHVNNISQDVRFDHETGPLEFGRGRAREVERFVIDDTTVSRDQLLIEEIPGNRVRLTNLSGSQPITLDTGATVGTGGSVELALPLALSVGLTLIELESGNAAADPDGYLTIARPVRSAEEGLRLTGGRNAAGGNAPGGGTDFDPETVTRWLETVLALQRTATANTDFFGQTARAVVELVGLDLGMVLLRQDEAWQITARHAPAEEDIALRFSRTVLNRVVQTGRTFYQDFGESNSIASLQNAEAVVASPIFGVDGQVVGVVYGMRKINLRTMAVGVRPLQAQLVQLLASAVGSALARTAAVRTRVQFEQFFSPELVRELERDPNLLEGRNQEVTILVSDLRGFSTLAERMGPQNTCRLIRDMMERLSERIVQAGGVIVDYAGDGILSMWNAPIAQDDHVMRAARAAAEMHAEMPGLNQTWGAMTGAPLVLGIGLNTGEAQVGNTGSSRKLKYGPHGHTVNMASRVQDATKKLGVPIVITGATREKLGDGYVVRRLCRGRLAGIVKPVELFELRRDPVPAEWAARRDGYEAALTAFEAGDFKAAALAIKPLVEGMQDENQDRPAALLFRRLRECVKNPPAEFDPVWDLTTK